MIEIKVNCLYSRADLAEMLAPAGLDVDTFIARLRPRKVFKMVWLGADLLKAFEAAPALADRDPAPELPAAKNRGGRKSRGAADPCAKLDDYLHTLKGGRS